MLPSVDYPQAFGQHPNADITALISETRILTETLTSIQSSSSSGKEGEKKEDRVSILLTISILITDSCQFILKCVSYSYLIMFCNN